MVHHVEKLVRAFRRSQEVDELSRETRQQANRKLLWYHDADGSLVLHGRLPAPRLGARRADALGIMAESFLAHGSESLNRGERQQIVVHVDAETLKHRSAGRCELEDGPSLPAETARRLACDASLVEIVEDEDGEPLTVGRKTRSIPSAIHRALNARDKGCRFPGCTHSRYVESHHVRHWADGGETKLSNLALLCKFHHRLVHEGGVIIRVLDDGALQFLNSNGRPFEDKTAEIGRVAGDWTQLVAAHRQQALDIDAKTTVTRWRGEVMDYGLAVQALLQRSSRARVGASNFDDSSSPRADSSVAQLLISQMPSADGRPASIRRCV